MHADSSRLVTSFSQFFVSFLFVIIFLSRFSMLCSLFFHLCLFSSCLTDVGMLDVEMVGQDASNARPEDKDAPNAELEDEDAPDAEPVATSADLPAVGANLPATATNLPAAAPPLPAT